MIKPKENVDLGLTDEQWMQTSEVVVTVLNLRDNVEKFGWVMLALYHKRKKLTAGYWKYKAIFNLIKDCPGCQTVPHQILVQAVSMIGWIELDADPEPQEAKVH